MLALATTVCGCSRNDGTAPNAAPAHHAPASDASQRAGTRVTGTAPTAAGGAPAVVVLEPRHALALPPPDGVPYMDQEARTFLPPVMFVRTGHPAEFRNSDEEMHNVNVKDLENRAQLFNVAIPVGGKYTHRFDATGIFDVSCDVHPGMSAEIVATSSPYVTLTRPDGGFSFDGVVPGPYTLLVYAGEQKVEKPIEVSGAATSLEASADR